LFGRGAEGLIPVFQQGLGQMGDELERIGGVMDENIVKRLDDIGDAFDKLKFKTRSWAAEFTVDAAYILGVFGQVIKEGNIVGGLDRMKAIMREDAIKALGSSMNTPAAAPKASGQSMFSDIFAEKEAEGGKAKSARRQSFRLGIDEISRAGGLQGLAGTRNVQLEVAQQQLNVQKKIETNTRKGQGSGLQLAP
jgi:hypothetical protein